MACDTKSLHSTTRQLKRLIPKLLLFCLPLRRPHVGLVPEARKGKSREFGCVNKAPVLVPSYLSPQVPILSLVSCSSPQYPSHLPAPSHQQRNQYSQLHFLFIIVSLYTFVSMRLLISCQTKIRLCHHAMITEKHS
jgi:hypothetical protein